MISLRYLEKKDAPLMLEWMHDKDIQKCFQKRMLDKTLKEAESFCLRAKKIEDLVSGDSLHYAVVDSHDEYMGTISLKSINLEHGHAEYAISMRKKAQGKHYATEATEQILKVGFETLGINRIYLNVLANNAHAIRFYEKRGFIYEGEFRKHCLIDGKLISLFWYSMLKEEYYKNIRNDIGER